MKFSLTGSRIALLLAALLLALAAGCKSKGDGDVDEGVTAVELYERAKLSMRNGSYDRAIDSYRVLQSRFPFGRYAEQAQLELAYAYHKNYEPDLAISTLDRFLKTYPTHRHVDYAYYLKGLINFSRNRGVLSRVFSVDSSSRDLEYARDSFRSFSQLLQKFPDSKYAPDARERMLYLRNEMANAEIQVADYYMRRKAYVAAAKRAQYVLENFQQAPQTADALAIMTQAYESLELAALSEDAYRVLKLNYPDHPYITGRYESESWLKKLWPFD